MNFYYNTVNKHSVGSSQLCGHDKWPRRRFRTKEFTLLGLQGYLLSHLGTQIISKICIICYNLWGPSCLSGDGTKCQCACKRSHLVTSGLHLKLSVFFILGYALLVCVCVGVCYFELGVCVQVLPSESRSFRSHRARAGGCEPPVVDAGNQTLVTCRNTSLLLCAFLL